VGHPVPLRAQPAPSLTTVYCVLTFWRDRHKLAFGKLVQFTSLEAALKAGSRAAVRNAGVVVLSLTGSPEFSLWDPPRVFAVHGDVPELSREGGYLWV
jgi:hypothetical protein